MLNISQVTKNFGSLVAVNNLSLTVAKGEIFGLLGPNGAGKTTTLKMVTGVMLPTSGNITISGLDSAAHPDEAKALMGYIPDEPYVYEKLTGAEFLRFVADLHSVPRATLQEQLKEFIPLFGLNDIIHRRVDEYSRGNRQRLSFLSALLHSPQLLVIDEPVVGLDPASIRMVKLLLRRLVEQQGVAVLLSTHTLSIAEEICDRMGVLHNGKLLDVGTLADFRLHAHSVGGSLEDLFLAMTDGKA